MNATRTVKPSTIHLLLSVAILLGSHNVLADDYFQPMSDGIYYEVWRNSTSDFSSALRVAAWLPDMPNPTWNDPSPSTGPSYYWVRALNAMTCTLIKTGISGNTIGLTITVPTQAQPGVMTPIIGQVSATPATVFYGDYSYSVRADTGSIFGPSTILAVSEPNTSATHSNPFGSSFSLLSDLGQYAPAGTTLPVGVNFTKDWSWNLEVPRIAVSMQSQLAQAPTVSRAIRNSNGTVTLNWNAVSGNTNFGVPTRLSQNVFHMGGTRNPQTGQWTGLASLETVPVGNPGNAADTAAHSGRPAGQGQVNYTYNIGKYEVTAGQYCAFLNAVGGVDTYSLYNTNMSRTDYGCGIARSGGGTVGDPYTYSLATDFANRPVNYTSYWDACRFANWLNNGQPTGLQGPDTTENGTYTLNGYNGTDGGNIWRNPGGVWAITSDDEWYKAAYYKGGSTDAGYWDYPTRGNSTPGNDMADASGNNANHYTGSGPYPIDNGKYTTVVGEFQDSASPYGTFDQGGNVCEWSEAIEYAYPTVAARGLRGGAFNDGGNGVALMAWRGTWQNPIIEEFKMGFRVSGLLVLPQPHPGDANNDGAVDVVDLGVLAKNYDTASGATWAMADFSGDGAVNVVDLGILAKNYDWVGAPAGAVPEPASMSLLVLGGLALLRRRSH